MVSFFFKFVKCLLQILTIQNFVYLYAIEPRRSYIYRVGEALNQIYPKKGLICDSRVGEPSSGIFLCLCVDSALNRKLRSNTAKPVSSHFLVLGQIILFEQVSGLTQEC